jgi:hypothetical protein
MTAKPAQVPSAGGKEPEPRPADNEPTDGSEAQKRREKMQHQDKAEGDRRK